MVEIITGWLLFVLLVGGLGIPLVAKLPGSAEERLCLGIATGVVVTYIGSCLVYWFELPPSAYRSLPLLAVFLSVWKRRALLEIVSDTRVRVVLGLWAIVAGWCLGWLTLVRSYSGGEWVADWLEHYHRTLFFLKRLPLETIFLNTYILPARPPLANLFLAPCLGLTQGSFAYYQVFLTLFSSLAFFPCALLAQRFRASVTIHPAAGLAVLLMFSPLFVGNATFCWTKLPAAFFVLTALYFFLRDSGSFSNMSALALGAALLTHYSAAPYAIALVGWTIWQRRDSWFQLSHWRSALLPLCAAIGLLSTWFVWSAWHYGYATFGSNTAVNNAEGLSWREHLVRRAENLVTLIVPHPFRAAEYAPLAQESAVGLWRDHFFNLYQTNLLFAFGTGGVVALAVLIWRFRKHLSPFWTWFIGIVLILHTMVISWADRWGSVHIDLQPLVLLGLCWIAGNFSTFSRPLRAWIAAGLTFDLCAGIGLHFVRQHIDLSLVYRDFRDDESVLSLGFATWSNYYSKASLHLRFVGDQNFSPPVLGAILALTLLLALRLAHRGYSCVDVPTDSKPGSQDVMYDAEVK